jgi:hypothetical protein
MVTAAPDTTAPLESVTVPVMPALACAKAVRGVNNSNPMNTNAIAQAIDGIRIGTGSEERP